MFSFFSRLALARNGVSRVLIAGSGDLAEMTAANLAKYGHFGLEVGGFLGPGRGARNDSREMCRSGEGGQEARHHRSFLALPLKEYSTIMKLIEPATTCCSTSAWSPTSCSWPR